MSQKLGPEMWQAIPAIRRELIIKGMVGYPAPSDPPDVLYHYTAPNAFTAIVNDHTSWLTNAAYLNDQGELAYPVEVALEALARRRRSAPAPAIESFLARVQQTLQSHIEYKDWYIASFATQGDLLSQWRAYCPQGGYSLGFYGPRLVSILLRQGAFELRPVEYVRDRQIAILEETITKYELIYEELRKKHPELSDSEIRFEVASALGIMLSLQFITFKSPAFAEEHEWRIVRRYDDDDPLLFRERQGLLTPYMVVDLADEDGRLPLAHVYTSPLVDGELARYAAISLLQKRGYSSAERLLKIPAYRLRF
jgi:Protein of unknown function (DUF2971)